MRSNAKIIWKYIGFSHHSVPSLSNVARRSAGWTKSLLPGVVTFSTKEMIADFVAPSFQEGRWSSAERRDGRAT